MTLKLPAARGALCAIGLALVTATASAQQAQPAVIYDMGGKFDKSFNEAAFNGSERWKKETGKNYPDF